MDKYFNNSAILIVDKITTVKHYLNFLYKYNFKKVIFIKNKNIKIKKELLKTFNFETKVVNFSSEKFTYDILKKKNIKNKISGNLLVIRTSKFINLNLFKLYDIFLKNNQKLVITLTKYNKKFENTEFFFLKSYLIDKYDFSFHNLYKNKKYKIYFVQNEYFKLKKNHTKKQVNQFFSSIYSNVVILDRDGVINENKGYVGFKKDFKFQSGAIKAIKYLYNNNYNIFVVSNQSGISRGYFKLRDVEELHEYLRNIIIKNQATINKIYYSPYHKDGIIKKYKKNSSCRKPGIKLFKTLVKEWSIKDKSRILMIGDQISDQKFAYNANIKFSFFKKGNLYNFIKKLNIGIN
jgi:D-glycero-D-manno-heptose 1,7-bisphosphate phosphatase